MDDDKITSLKREINNFIHEHGPDAMTLKQAERAACILLEAFLEAQGPPADTYVNRPCPTCSEVGSEVAADNSDFANCMACGERWLL